MRTSVDDAAAAAAAAEQDVDRAETDLASGSRSVTAAALHKLRDTWRHADLTAQSARQRAEQQRREARLSGLTAIGAEVDKLAAGDEMEALGDALRVVAMACARVRDIAGAHDTAVASLVAAAADLGAEPMAPGGPRGTSGYVAVKGTAIIHKRVTVSPVGSRIRAALEHAMSGDPDRAVAEVGAATQLPEPKRPDYLLRGANGMIISMTGPLNQGMEAQVRTGGVTLLSEHDIDLYMAGELA